MRPQARPWARQSLVYNSPGQRDWPRSVLWLPMTVPFEAVV